MFDIVGKVFRKAYLGDSSVQPRGVPAILDLRRAFHQVGSVIYTRYLDLTGSVPCQLIAWQRTNTGQWMAWVQVRLTYQPGSVHDPQHTHLHLLVNADAVSQSVDDSSTSDR